MPDAPTTGPLPLPLSAFRSFGDRLRYTFDDPDLLVRALTHRSWCAEHAGFESNERLEFLGDAVLGLVVTDDIYCRLPDAGEGQLSRIRAEVVCAPSLAEMAAEIRVGEVLLLGKGEDASGGSERAQRLNSSHGPRRAGFPAPRARARATGRHCRRAIAGPKPWPGRTPRDAPRTR